MQTEINFFNTTHEEPVVVDEYSAINKSEKELIYALFLKKRVPMIWSDVAALINLPENGIKRGLTVLTYEKKLVITEMKKIGIRGRNCFMYELVK